MSSSDYVRVSYTIPPPTTPPPRLSLPPLGTNRNGSIRPLLVSAHPSTSKRNKKWSSDARTHWQHPRHRLGVSSLALDSRTRLQGKEYPEGILYTGGRDGQIISWDLSLKMRKRRQLYDSPENVSASRKDRWEILTGWSDGSEDDDDDDDVIGTDGDVLGDVVNASAIRTHKTSQRLDSVGSEEAWTLDFDSPRKLPTQHSIFRQSVQIHNDWINDILLCNFNQTVISASSDGSIRAWSPHASTPTDPALIGVHNDYVRCLATSSYQSWVASGSFDRTIKLWDLSRTTSVHNSPVPLSTLSLPSPSQKASIYAIATDMFGSVIASGSPERIVRMWDPRAGKRIGKLVGHTDNIRAIVLSDDGRYLLTGSADASIKLWAIASQRCLHTFAHHTESVWALSSQHPSLEVFYSGDRGGIVCRVDVEGCNTIDEGECLVICNGARQPEGDHPDTDGSSSDILRLQDGAGINRIVVMEDRFLWTSTGASDVKRWKTPPRRSVRMSLASDRNPIPLEQSSRRASGSSDLQSRRAVPIDFSIDGNFSSPVDPSGRHATVLSSQFNASAQDEQSLYGVPYNSLVKLISPADTYIGGGYRSQGKQEADVSTLYSAASVKSIPALGIRPSTSSVSPNSPNPGSFLYPSTLSPTFTPYHTEMNWVPSPRADFESRDLAAMAIPLEKDPDDIIQGEHGIVRSIVLNDRMHALTIDTSGCIAVWDIIRCHCIGWFDRDDVLSALGSPSTDASTESDNEFHSPREMLEMVRERIEGECVIASWSTVDTRIGNLTVHVSEKCFETEIYADEAGYGSERVYDGEQRLNIAKWILANLFDQFIREQIKMHHRSLSGSLPHRRHPHEEKRGVKGTASGTNKTISISVNAPSMIPAIPTSKSMIAPVETPLATITPTARPQTSIDIPVSAGHTNIKEIDYFNSKSKRTSLVSTVPDDFSGWGGPGANKDVNLLSTPTTPGGGGIMGKLRQFGKSSKRPSTGDNSASNNATVSTPGAQGPDNKDDDNSHIETEQLKYLHSLATQGFHPPSTSDAPPLHLPPDTQIILASETQAGWTTIYRGSVAHTAHDAHLLESLMPLWLMQYLLSNKTPIVPNIKVSFGIASWPGNDNASESSNSPARLTANRFLRVRKILGYVQDKIDVPSSQSGSRAGSISSTTPRSSVDAPRKASTAAFYSNPVIQSEVSKRSRPEDSYELLCNDVVLPLNMTLATIRHYIWRSGNELLLFYRRKN